jgi:type VI secretion system protein ImpC
VPMNAPQMRATRRVGWKPLRYTVEASGQEVEVPFVIGVIADLTGPSREHLRKTKERNFVHLDADNLDELLQNARVTISLEVENTLDPHAAQAPLKVDLAVRSMDDFAPASIVNQVPAMGRLLKERESLGSLAAVLETRPALIEEIKVVASTNSVQALLSGDHPTTNDAAYDFLTATIQALPEVAASKGLRSLTNVPGIILALNSSGIKEARDMREAVANRVTVIDATLSGQLDKILHHPAFQRIEGTWRGLAYLTKQAESGTLLKIKVLNLNLKEMERDFKTAIDFDQSMLFKRLYDEVGTFGFEPCSVVLCDIELTREPLSVYVARELSHVGAATWAPILLGPSYELFGLDRWSDLSKPRDLTKVFDTIDYAAWKNLRDSPDSAYLVCAVPPLLARLPWDTRTSFEDARFNYAEAIHSAEDYVWMNGAYGLAFVIANSFARDRWCADLRGPIWGRVEGISADFEAINTSLATVVGPTLLDLSERRHAELSLLGFTSIARHLHGRFAAILGPTVLARQRGDGRGGVGTESSASQLEHVLCTGRVVHVIMSFLKDHIGVWSSLDEELQALQHWLTSYCENSDPKGEAAQGPPAAPFRSVTVRRRDEPDGRETFTIDVEFNSVLVAGPFNRSLKISNPAGLLSSRIIP